VDQVYYDAKMVCPWQPGTHNQRRTSGMCSAARGVSDAGVPSDTFVLLFKLFTMRPSAQQLATLINHQDSPYIRGLGFLYLRYCCDPKKIWAWFENYVSDPEELYIQGDKVDKTTTTLGQFLRTLLKELNFHDTMLPRIPVAVSKEIQGKLQEMPLEPSASDGHAGYGGQDMGDDRGGGGGGYGGHNRGDDRGYGGRDDGRGYQDLDAPRAKDRDRDKDRDYDRRDRDRDYDRRDRDRDYDRRDKDRDDRRDKDRDYDRRDDRDRRR